MTHGLLAIFMMMALPSLWGVGGCSKIDEPAPAPRGREPRRPLSEEPPALLPQHLLILHGRVIRREGSRRTFEAWNAPGAPYYVLDVGTTALPPERRSAKEGVTLRPSRYFSNAAFKPFAGCDVVVEGIFVDAKPWAPSSQGEVYPSGDVDPVTGEMTYPGRGSGFEVYKVTRIEDPVPPPIDE